jgi:sRNA-binding protein
MSLRDPEHARVDGRPAGVVTERKAGSARGRIAKRRKQKLEHRAAQQKTGADEQHNKSFLVDEWRRPRPEADRKRGRSLSSN